MEKAKLSDIAKHTLKQICSQEWVHNRCLQVSFIFLFLPFYLIFDRELNSPRGPECTNVGLFLPNLNRDIA